MELLIGLAMKFWQWSLLIAFVILGLVSTYLIEKAKMLYFCIYINADLKLTY